MKSALFSLITILTSCLLTAQAATVSDENEWRLRDKASQEAQAKKLKNSTPPIQLPKVEALLPPAKENICFVIDSIKIQGLLSDWAKKQGQSYIGQCVGMEGIQTYIRLINKQLLSQGYMTSRAILPEQNLSSKVLTIKILEGVIEAIEFPHHYRFNWQYALPLKVGNILNLRDMEQAVDQLNRLQSQNIEFKVKPGKESNGSILVAEVKETKRWYINSSIDNSGSSSTGEYPVSVNGGFDNAFFIQDPLPTHYH